MSTKEAAIFGGPGYQYNIIDQAKQFSSLVGTGPAVNGWVPVRSTIGVNGYIEIVKIKEGNARAAYIQSCKENPGRTIFNNEVLIRKGEGLHVITFKNGLSTDGLVQLRTIFGKVALAFFVFAGSEAKIENLPDGTYKILFMTGKQYSRTCNIFTEQMQIQAFKKLETFRRTEDENYYYYTTLELTLHPVLGGNASTEDVNLDEFLKGLQK